MLSPSEQTILLTDRRVLRVEGPDAADFLQNVMTNDIARAQPLVYSCLLSPQGQFLHDFFVYRQTDDAFLLDVDAVQAPELLRRLGIFKLRAKVTMAFDDNIYVYATPEGAADPRHPGIGGRAYMTDKRETPDVSLYTDHCISLGVPPSAALLAQKDVLADVNLDIIPAVAWDKGCFIGQEVTARMKHRALAKKRLMIVSGNALPKEAGDVRITNSTGTQSLAVVKLAARQVLASSLENLLTIPDYLAEVVKN